MAFVKKTWVNQGETGATPLNATNLNDLETRIANGLSDTGWLNLPLEAGISVGSIVKKAQYRKIGKIVYLRGDVQGVTGAGTLIGTLPSGYRPSTHHYFFGEASGKRYVRFYIFSNGTINLEWVSDDNYDLTWFAIDTSFLVD